LIKNILDWRESKMSRFSVKTEHGAARCAGTVFAVFINERIYDTTTLNDTEHTNFVGLRKLGPDGNFYATSLRK
jgi:hypothetical protein